MNDRLVRLTDIIGTNGNNAIIPVSRSTWLSGVKQGRYPQPIKIAKNAVAWRLSEVLKLVNGEVVV
jgi:prophage regulatory protein